MENTSNTDRVREHVIRDEDLGLGRTITKRGRFLKSNGRPNIRRINQRRFGGLSLYQRLTVCPGWMFFALVFALYASLNVAFGSIYYLVGADSFYGIPQGSYLKFVFFSSQTLTTVGYGGIYPIGNIASTLAAMEALLGLLLFALITGLLYARFSKAKLRLCFSEHALVGPYKGITAVMFRFVNERYNELFDVRVHVTGTWIDHSSGKPERKYRRLELEQERIVNFYLNWTVCHPIDESSPVYGWSEERFEETDFELIINISAYDELFGQSIRVSRSYKWSDFLFGSKFQPMYWMSEDGVVEMDLNLLSTHAVPETSVRLNGHH